MKRLSFLLSVLSPTLAFGQDVSDDSVEEEYIIRQEDGTIRVAGSAHVIDEDELKAFEYDDVGRALSQTPGLYVRDEDGYGLRPNIGIRGANSDRSAKVMLLEDGVPLVPAPYAAPAAYYFPMTTRVTGIEVYKGPASTQHGPQTVGGAVNLITRAVPTRPTAALDLAAGLRQTMKLHAYGGNGSERMGWIGEVSHLQTGGFKTLQSGADTGFERTDVLLKTSIRSDPAATRRHRLTLKLGWGNERSNETYLGLHQTDFDVDPNQRYAASELGLMEWTRTQVELAHQYDAKRVRIRTTAYHHGLERAWNKLNRFADGPALHDVLQGPNSGANGVWLAILRGDEDSTSASQNLQIGTNDRRFHSFGVQSRGTLRHQTDAVDSQLEFGARVHADRVDRVHTEIPYAMRASTLVPQGPEQTNLDSRATATALALFVHEDLDWKGIHIVPGLRSETVLTRSTKKDEDTVEALRTTLLPGLAVMTSAREESLQLFAGIHRGFSPVSPGQDTSIRPESSTNTELGMRWNGEERGLEAVAYFSDYARLVGTCTVSGGCADELIDQQFNGGRVFVYGAELMGHVTVALPNRFTWTTSGTYTLTQSSFRTDLPGSPFPQFGSISMGDRLPYVAEHQGGLRMTLSHPAFRVHGSLTGRTGMRDTASQGPLTDGDVPALVQLDIAAHVPLSKWLESYVTVTNATDTQPITSWRPFGARPLAPRQIMVGVTFDR